MNTIKIAVIGNPNSGKSTLINAICGSSLHVGNWPGVTIEKKEAIMKFHNYNFLFVDLPGVYSLSPFSMEEVISRDFLINEHPDIILNVVDATNFERNLYLTLQLLELNIPIVMALNIYDEAESKGIKFNLEKIEEKLNIKVIPTVATKKQGIKQILDNILAVYEDKDRYQNIKLNYGDDIENLKEKMSNIIYLEKPILFEKYPQNYLLMKLLENDEKLLNDPDIKSFESLINIISNLKKQYGEDLTSLIPDARYHIAEEIVNEIITKPERYKKDITEKLDSIFLHKILSIPIFFIMMWIVFKISFDFSSPFIDWFDRLFNEYITKWSEASLNYFHSPDWLISLINEGIIGGVGMILTFLPVIATVMFILTFLEGSGYMARAAFVMDRLMNTIGLHGKSFIPLIISFGCNVPGIYATRTLESERDRKLTAILTQFMSCGARLPVYLLFAGIFFKENSGTIIWLIYILGILIAIIVGLILQKTVFKGEKSIFIMELPPYRIPTLNDLIKFTWNKLKHFVVRAGTYLLGASIVIWFLLNMPWGIEDKKESYLGIAGQVIEPILQPLGFGNWESGASLITGIIAKEAVVSTMSQIYGEKEKKDDNKNNEPLNFVEDLKNIGIDLGNAFVESIKNIIGNIGIESISIDNKKDNNDNQETNILKERLKQQFNTASAFSFMVFVLLYFPCIVTLISAKTEFQSWSFVKWMIIIATASGWITSFVIYQSLKLLGIGG